jgi:hypothetical protein
MLKTLENAFFIAAVALTVGWVYAAVVDPAAAAIEQGFWTAQQLTIVSQ